MANGRLFVVLGVASALLAGVVVAVILLRGSPPAPLRSSAQAPPTATASAGSATEPEFGVEDAAQLQSALGSGDPGRLAPVIVKAPGDRIDDAFAAQLAAARLQIDSATFTPGEQGTATVQASTMSGGEPARWLLVLTSVSGRWQLSATAKLP